MAGARSTDHPDGAAGHPPGSDRVVSTYNISPDLEHHAGIE